MHTTDSPTLQVRGPADLLAAVPYLLGFHPHESLVIIGLADNRVIVTARLDLTDVTHLTGSRLLADTLAAIKRGDAASVVGAIFTDTLAPSNAVAAHLAAEAQQVALDLIDTLAVAAGRWRSLEFGDAQCCPAEGTPMSAAPTALDAAATYAGLTALPGRGALAQMFTPVPDRVELADQLEHHYHEQLSAAPTGKQHTHDRSVIRALFAAHRAAQAGRMPTGEQVARFGVALQSHGVRDALWLAVDDGRLRGIELWVNLARRLPSPYRAAPLFLAAWRAYRDGNGALANIAADLAGDLRRRLQRRRPPTRRPAKRDRPRQAPRAPRSRSRARR